MLRILSVITFLALFCVSAVADVLPKPTLEPRPSTEEARQLIRAGIQMHDLRDYDGAINNYKMVLRDNPDDVLALYELAYSYYHKKDYANAIKTAMAGAKYKSKHLTHLYVTLGSTYDDMGQPQKALEIYREALKMAPNEHLLHFNAGVTHTRMGNYAEAKKSFRASLLLNPNHPSSHYYLAHSLVRSGLPIPAVLALGRFLVLEPNSSRSADALRNIRGIMTAGVTKDEKEPNTIKINISQLDNKEEGDFGPLEVAMSIAVAAGHLEEGKRKNELEQLVSAFEMAGEILAGQKHNKKSAFSSYYYGPYYGEMSRKKLVEPFVYFILRGSNTPGGAEWLEKNKDQVQAFLEWDRAYQWRNGN